jgi:hypothetical protein
VEWNESIDTLWTTTPIGDLSIDLDLNEIHCERLLRPPSRRLDTRRLGAGAIVVATRAAIVETRSPRAI